MEARWRRSSRRREHSREAAGAGGGGDGRQPVPAVGLPPERGAGGAGGLPGYPRHRRGGAEGCGLVSAVSFELRDAGAVRGESVDHAGDQIVTNIILASPESEQRVDTVIQGLIELNLDVPRTNGKALSARYGPTNTL